MASTLPDQEMAARLRWARKDAGFDSAAEAWRAHHFGVKLATYQQYENGTRGFAKQVARLAAAFRVSENWLRSGRGNPKGSRTPVQVVGVVGPFGIIQSPEKKMSSETADLVEAPPVAGDSPMLAYRVVRDDNYPALFAGDVVYTGQPQDPERCIGKHCIATLRDGSKRTCILARAAANDLGAYLLISLNASPLVADVVEAALVLWIKRG